MLHMCTCLKDSESWIDQTREQNQGIKWWHGLTTKNAKKQPNTNCEYVCTKNVFLWNTLFVFCIIVVYLYSIYIYIQSNIQIQNDYIVQRSSDLTFLSNFPKNDRTIERSFVEKRLGTILTLPRLTSLPFIASTSHCLNFELLQPHITLSILTSHQLLPLHMNSTSHCLNFALP